MKLAIAFASLAAGGAMLAATSAFAGETFDAVKERGEVVCGVHTGLFGFGAPDDKGVYQGLDADVCRAIAAAVFGDAQKVKFVPLTAQQRFTALQSGEIDMRSMEIPIWILFVPMPLCFFMLTIEFIRYLIGIDDMYSQDLVERETV